MSGRKRRPFGDALEIERGGDEPSGPRILSVQREAREGATRLMGQGVDRLDALPLRTQALLMAGGGGLACLVLWGVRIATGNTVSDLAPDARWPWMVVVACSAIAAFGVLQLVFETASSTVPSAADGRFGSFVAADQEESRWKRRLAAVAIGLIHTAVYFWW